MADTVNVTIDGTPLQVDPKLTILQAAATVGGDIPHYCYHPGLSIAGNCRMCLVMVDKMPKPVIACKTQVAEGMVIHTSTPEVKKMQQNIMEFLLVNHPLDCPTCDQAGECRLQDYYMKYDVQPSRYHEEKVHKDKMVDLGAGVMLDEERCIVCTRCVRFCEEVAGNAELYVQERGNHSMVSTFPGQPMTNPYAGCTVDVCPVGALTSKDFRYKKRVWFLKSAPSICDGCSRGCNIEIHHADNKVYRYKPRFNPDVNRYWMCDFGRDDYKYINDGRRLRPMLRESQGLIEVRAEQAMQKALSLMRNQAAQEIAFVASALESNESIDAFVKMAREQFGAKEVYFSSREVKNPFSDQILIQADKNPNRAHIQKCGLRSLRDIPANVKSLVVQRSLSDADVEWIESRKIDITLLFATNASHLENKVQILLPLTTLAEQDGHFTNFEGRVQEFQKAFEPRGESKTTAHWASLFALAGDIFKKVG